MKLEELIGEYELSGKAEAALKAVDWNYDLGGVESPRFERGQKSMMEAQLALRALYKSDAELAEKLWTTHCPYAKEGVLPSWVLR